MPLEIHLIQGQISRMTQSDSNTESLIYYLGFQLNACMLTRDKGHCVCVCFCNLYNAMWTICVPPHLCQFAATYFSFVRVIAGIVFFTNPLYCPMFRERTLYSWMLSVRLGTRELISGLFVNHSLKYLLRTYSVSLRYWALGCCITPDTWKRR